MKKQPVKYFPIFCGQCGHIEPIGGYVYGLDDSTAPALQFCQKCYRSKRRSK